MRWAIMFFYLGSIVAAARMTMIEQFLSPAGIGPGLRELKVRFGPKLQLHGEESLIIQRSKSTSEMRKEPLIEWDPALGNLTLLFLDLDAGSGMTEDLSKAGEKGPFPHSIWSHCVADASMQLAPTKSCTVLKPWAGPGNTAPVANRYVFIAFQQTSAAPVTVAGAFPGPHKLGQSKGWKFGTAFSLSRFMADNPGLKPWGYNFAQVRGPKRAHARAR